MKRGLIVFARQPLPGTVKTRLAGELGARAATKLYSAMLEDVLELVSGLDDTRLLVFWSLESGTPPDYPGLEMFIQSGGTLGERMANAFATAFADGIHCCCIIGSDSPDLPLEYIRQAFLELEQERADVVFGPAEDGGYYLLGMRRLLRRLFEDISWSTPQVLETSLERARELELRSIQLPAWYDLDRVADLERLAGATGQAAPRTRAVIRSMNGIFQSTKPTGEL